MSYYILKLRNRHYFLLDVLIFLVTPFVALSLRLDTIYIPADLLPILFLYAGAGLLLRLLVFQTFGLYTRYWAYASIDDLLQIGLAVAVSSALLGIIMVIVRALEPATRAFPRSMPLIEALLVFLLVGGTRFSARFSHSRRHTPADDSRRVLVYGAGDAGSMIVREMQDKSHLGYKPVAFLDDDPLKQNIRLHGLPVLGGRESLLQVVTDQKIDRVIIAMPTAPGEIVREIASACDLIQVNTKIVPNISEILGGQITVGQLRDVDIQDLLRRDPVRTDIDAVRRSLAGQRVLVTGGGGSIGGELCRQILYCLPDELVILGHGENSIFEIYHELKGLGVQGPRLKPIIADIRSVGRLDNIFKQIRPQVIFHAAAHKHVPLMELNPAEAITNNVLGTRNLLNVALQYGVGRFVMVSTDKAVNPVNVMGASKRVAEMLVYDAAKQSGLPYVTVRFGNVLGSRGSVVMTFKKQIANGGPVTVTDPAAKRYFMTIPEAVQLVLQASILGNGGEVFVLDMGEPVYIDQLARDMIALSGLEPDVDIPIEYVGLRPGDKLFEELFTGDESYQRTGHHKIFMAGRPMVEDNGLVAEDINALLNSANRSDRDEIRAILCKLVPDYYPSA